MIQLYILQFKLNHYEIEQYYFNNYTLPRDKMQNFPFSATTSSMMKLARCSCGPIISESRSSWVPRSRRCHWRKRHWNAQVLSKTVVCFIELTSVYKMKSIHIRRSPSNVSSQVYLCIAHTSRRTRIGSCPLDVHLRVCFSAFGSSIFVAICFLCVIHIAVA